MKRIHHNPVTKVDPVVVAKLFSRDNLYEDNEHQSVDRILDHIRGQRFDDARRIIDDFVRPEFLDGRSYYARKQFASLVTKVPFKGSHAARRERAVSAFLSSEAKCRRTNKRLAFFSRNPNRIPGLIRVVLSRSKEYIRRVLGDFSENKLEQLIQHSRPGRGVSVGTHNRFRVSLPFKLGRDTDLCCTPRARPYARMLVESSRRWLVLHMEADFSARTYSVPYITAAGNRISFVPKDARTLRTIAVEPSLNVCLQLGVHQYLADRLRVFGNPIDDQSFNQRLAKRGSERGFATDGLSTIDLSQASDSLSSELVRMLLPPVWFDYLCDLRCESGTLEGVDLQYSKFSSMGNGYTFALETLIFLSLAKACASLTDDGIASVYGDDIIVGTGCTALLIEALQFVGFTINSDKTFCVGPFRESCGADWHAGKRVTPQYLRTWKVRATDIYRLLNSLDPIFEPDRIRGYCLRKLSEVSEVLQGLEHEDTSTCLFTPLDKLKRSKHIVWHQAWRTWRFRGLVFRPAKESIPVQYAFSASLFGGGTIDSERAPVRGIGNYTICYLTPGITQGLPRWSLDSL